MFFKKVALEKVNLRFDGNDFDGHLININDLIPALLGFNDLVNETNRMLNGDRVKIDIQVKGDTEQHCFEIAFRITSSIIENAKSFFNNISIRDICEILNITGLIPAVGCLGFLQLYKIISKNKVEKIETATDNNGKKITIINLGNNNTFNVGNETISLLKNKNACEAVKSMAKTINNENKKI
jgi:hypothetical protein